MARQRILLVDDHEVVRLGLRALLDQHPNFDVVAEAETAREGKEGCRWLWYSPFFRSDPGWPKLENPHEYAQAGGREAEERARRRRSSRSLPTLPAPY